ncbi:MAG: regulatory protein RecX [Spirochaetales bacterium]|nr:regulatory protein RecX [Spirochaetales bacterium]
MAGEESESLHEQLFPSTYTVLGASYSRAGDSVKLSLSHEETLVLPAEKYALSGLKEGSDLTRDNLLNLKKDETVHTARKRALKALERREYTASQLKRKLSEAMFPKEIIAAVLKDLRERGYLSDEKYARAWIESQLKRKRQGRRLLFNGLVQKGVSREEAERSIGEAYTEDQEEAACEALMRKLASRRGFIFGELFPFMARRGFSPSLIKEVFGRLKKEA